MDWNFFGAIISSSRRENVLLFFLIVFLNYPFSKEYIGFVSLRVCECVEASVRLFLCLKRCMANERD